MCASKEQMYKIQEVLRHPSQYQDRLKPEDWPATGEYAKSFNKFCPKKVEVNEAMVEEAIKFGQYLKRSEEDIAEAIDIYKSLGNDTFYGPEEESTAEPQEQQDQWLPSQYDPDAYYSTVQTSAPRQIDCFTIAYGKKTGTTFPITFNNNQNYNALYDTGASASLHCASDHQSRDCPMRQQHKANTTSSPASGPGMLHTSKFIMDEMSGQFYAIYGNTYQWMSTKPMLEQSWGTGELIDQLAVTQQAFGYTGLSGPTSPLNQPQPTASTTCNPQDDILSKKPAPKNVQYQPPTFSLERPTECLTMEERIQVHNNYISAISNREHKKDLINRLKRSNPHNIPAYEAEMTHHMVMHDDVLGRILTILKQDDY